MIKACLKKFLIFAFMMCLCPFALASNPAPSTDEATPPKEWTIFLENLKKEMLAKGISKETLEKAYGNQTFYHYRPEVVEKDKKQTEFVLTTTTYINRLVNPNRVKNARKKYALLRKKYVSLEERYNVPLNYLTAFWAIETNFGQNKGRYHLIDSLTNLSYKNRRADFFKNELYNVLKIMERYNLENDKIMGSWAGAMGHFQFMPSTYNAYAVDYDADGVIDIWDSFDDAIGSAANYLNSLGWEKDIPWGYQIILPWNFDFRLSGLKNTKTVKQWKQLGIKTKKGKLLPSEDNLKASVIIPDGRKGTAYLVLGNFRKIMIWNRSENYALAVSLLADWIVSSDQYKPLSQDNLYALTDEDIKKIQHFANKVLKIRLKEDGKLGPKTKEAVKRLQVKLKLHPDGFPDYQLLNKIGKYDLVHGFVIPVQPIKAKFQSQK